jgi:hypothetical protein
LVGLSSYFTAFADHLNVDLSIASPKALGLVEIVLFRTSDFIKYPEDALTGVIRHHNVAFSGPVLTLFVPAKFVAG